jgi:4-amino-4-deoxy-L-arabinose transferase-like glycosyltransferase
VVLLAILGLMATLRLYHFRVPFVDTSDWRQTDTAAIAYFYYHLGIALLHPQLWHDGPGPDYTQLELQITPAIAALLAHVFGYGHVLLRLVAIGLDTASAIPLWALARRRLGARAACWTALTYALLPLGIYFGRVFQPEPVMLLTGNAALWAADRFGQRPTLGRYGAALALLALAILAKLPNGLLILPALVLALGPGHPRLRPRSGGARAFALRLGVLAGLAAIPSLLAAWYTIAVGQNAPSGTRYVSFIIRSLPDGYIAGQTDFWRFLGHNVAGMAVTPAGGAAALVGLILLLPRWRHGRQAWLLAWGVALAAYAVVVLHAIRLQYYLMPLLPWIALMAGVGLAWFAAGAPGHPMARREEPPAPGRRWVWRRRLGTAAAALLTVSVLSGGLFQIASYWPPYWPWYQLGLALRRTLPPDATILVGGTYNPTLLYYARRHGWRANPITARVVESSQADYLVLVVNPGTCMDAFLAAHYASFLVAGTPVYDLRQPLPSASSAGAGVGASSLAAASPSSSSASSASPSANRCAATGSP